MELFGLRKIYTLGSSSDWKTFKSLLKWNLQMEEGRGELNLPHQINPQEWCQKLELFILVKKFPCKIVSAKSLGPSPPHLLTDIYWFIEAGIVVNVGLSFPYLSLVSRYNSGFNWQTDHFLLEHPERKGVKEKAFLKNISLQSSSLCLLIA